MFFIGKQETNFRNVPSEGISFETLAKELVKAEKEPPSLEAFSKSNKNLKKEVHSVTGRTGHQAGGSGGVTTIVLKGSLPQLRETKLKNNSWQWRMDRTEVKQRGRENKFPLNGQYFGRFL